MQLIEPRAGRLLVRRNLHLGVGFLAATSGMRPQQLIAFAFQELTAKADKIGNLNISPELLSELLANPGGKK